MLLTFIDSIAKCFISEGKNDYQQNEVTLYVTTPVKENPNIGGRGVACEWNFKKCIEHNLNSNINVWLWMLQNTQKLKKKTKISIVRNCYA